MLWEFFTLRCLKFQLLLLELSAKDRSFQGPHNTQEISETSEVKSSQPEDSRPDP